MVSIRDGVTMVTETVSSIGVTALGTAGHGTLIVHWVMTDTIIVGYHGNLPSQWYPSEMVYPW